MPGGEENDGVALRAVGVDVFAADAEVGSDLAAVDWAATPLGPPEDWPLSLQTTVRILLSSKFPMWMAWGEQLTFFCNAAYRHATLGHKYPWALGRPANAVWAEIWDDIGPRVRTVLSSGQATWDEGLLLFLERSGYSEETYHTFSYSPLRDDSGDVVGMLCVVSEDTERVINERRIATLRDLGSDPSVVRTEQEVLSFAHQQLSRNREDLPFALTYLFEGSTARLAGTTGMPVGHLAAPPTLSTDDGNSLWPVATLSRGETAPVPLAGDAFSGLPAGTWPEPPVQALVVPLVQQGAPPFGFLVAALNRYRPLDEGYRGFVELTAGHIASGIASARSYEAEQRRAEELAELDRAKTAFFSNISHEFRTPLALIMGPVEELRDRLATAGDEARQELDVIHRNGLRLGRLVNTLLDFSRIEAGRMQAHYEPVDLGRVTAELASVFRSAIEKAGLAFDVDCPPLQEPVYVDRRLWEKVILNLVSNALKFTFEGSIRVSVRPAAGHAVVTVTDTGIGVPETEMPRLFERFHRIEYARSRSHEGSGIGLALVKELVGLHGGSITAASTEGVGTTFAVRVPFGTAHLPADATVTEPSGNAASTTVDPYVQEALRWLPDHSANRFAEETVVQTDDTRTPGSSATAAGARVLVADDNADMREYLTRILTGAGYAVTAVSDGHEAFQAVRRDSHDLVVSDVMMPRLDGLQLVTRMRGDARAASVPVLLLSARAGEEASIEGLEAGADDYLIKPFAAADLLARVRANIELARLRNHHTRWRSALIDSLQEGFFVCDESGTVVEINRAFTDILGYGPDSLPYEAGQQPWWPDPDTDPDAHQQVYKAFADFLRMPRGSFTLPATHSAGHRLWVTVTFTKAEDPDTGRLVTVGSLRDVTAEHYAVQRETALAALSTSLSEASSLEEALAGALHELQTLWRARRVLATVLGNGYVPALTATDPHLRWEDLPAERRRGIVTLGEKAPLTPVADATGAGVVLDHPDGVLALWIELGERRPFTPEDQLLLSLLAGRLAQGLVRAHQMDEQRHTALALQRAILGPARLPKGFAVRYEPATPPLEVGGDWYDTVPLPDGRIGIIVGDCVGRGLEAASVMGQLRSACRALMLQNTSPSETLMALDQFAAGVTGAPCTTVFCGALDSSTGELTYCSAGHPPGIIALPDGSTRLLDEGRSLPLAIRTGVRRPEGTYTLPPRGTLLLYTDGLVERRRRLLTDGIEEASRALEEGRTVPVDDLAARLLTRLAPADGYEDDVALLLYRHPAPLKVSFPADASQLATMRGTLREWLDQFELPPNAVQNILVAVGEACANAIEHGHRHSPGATVRLHAEVAVDRVHLTITDSGQWREPQPGREPHRGRGIPLMRAMMHHVTIAHSLSGTTVDMQMRIA
ncbi:SpoIIE family protein phosphatase [Streptomyces sp900105245]|uniref:histidine kinase n=1 Tax=Streptomyces albidocamelliae TaxID=2981135 RepID=A0ABY6EZL3_9ACTN|nr:SpoIIE family protein phosphatase [Streptomyces sp. HUAS 14-6]UXY39828.1 SpoIIE family protein phosphatase [Streptomyces sp. HUAS 14-6]